MAFNKGDKSDSSRVRRGGMHRRKKVCVFCGDKNGEIDYKEVNKLKIRIRERKNPPEKNHRQLRKAPESFNSSYQESTSYRSYAVHM